MPWTYLLCFGYEAPWERISNDSWGSDFESLGFFRIEAETEDEALRWGAELAAWFVRAVYSAEGHEDPGWSPDDWATWIEAEPTPELAAAAAQIDAVRLGQRPDVMQVLRVLGGPDEPTSP